MSLTAATTSVRSMTGQGRASAATERGTVNVEIRTVNHRGFKLSLRSGDAFAGLDSRIEATARQVIHRGAVTLSINLDLATGKTTSSINRQVLAGYISQCLEAVRQSDPMPGDQINLDVANLLNLPGVLEAVDSEIDVDQWWKQVEPVVLAALESLSEMRTTEGENMVRTLEQDCQSIREYLNVVSQLGPQATESYRQRLESKVKRVLAENELSVGQVDLLREVQIFADKSDVSEEVTRLSSHLDLFEATLRGSGGDGGAEPVGRKLDFIIQEMFREANTIGSKGAHQDTSSAVVEIKCAIERMRELVQNLE